MNSLAAIFLDDLHHLSVLPADVLIQIFWWKWNLVILLLLVNLMVFGHVVIVKMSDFSQLLLILPFQLFPSLTTKLVDELTSFQGHNLFLAPKSS